MLKAIDKRTIKFVLLVVGLVSFMMMSFNILGFIDGYSFSSMDMLDVKGFFTAETFRTAIASYQAMDQTGAYMILHIEDYLFILTFYPWLLLVLFHRLDMNKANLVWAIVPFLAMLFDLMENLIIDIALFGTVGDFGAGLVGFLTLLKFTLLGLTVILIAYQYYIKKRVTR